MLDKIRRGLKKPPRYLIERLLHEVHLQAERHSGPRRARKLNARALAQQAGYGSVSAWWAALGAQPHAATEDLTVAKLEALCPGELARIVRAAERALAHEVDLLGSGPVNLGEKIDWQRDYKTGHRWAPAYCRSIEYNNPERPSDVKFPWEVSRMQWMIPLGQAFVLTGDERYAHAARELIDHWIGENPYGQTVNWACTMDVALRILAWTWFFHAFKGSVAWTDETFRGRFLQALYLHGEFTSRNLEKSDVNGNHYTADAAGLVFAGLFFGTNPGAGRWLELGWTILCDELPRQVFEDGVDFEASVPYHRLVQELFVLPALYRRKRGLDVPAAYSDRLIAMARFTAGYSRGDGSVPLWGDADDGRALPFGGQALNDHRYLLGIAGAVFENRELLDAFSGSRSEILWLLGADEAASLPDRATRADAPKSASFPQGGFFVLRNRTDHVFVDCGPIGLAGRGGHGHNDLLSFEAVLEGAHLVTDAGAYLYTADYAERNRFRSTASHNTPCVDGEEINRFIRPDYLWTLHNDAGHEVRTVSFGTDIDRLIVSHDGFERLDAPVTVVRTFELEHSSHKLTIIDEFIGGGEHAVEIPLHLAEGVEVVREDDHAQLIAGGRRFELKWRSAGDWKVSIDPARVSPSYGVVRPTSRMTWRRRGSLHGLVIQISPMALR